MADIVCPNCQSVTPPFSYCIVCNSFLSELLKTLAQNRPEWTPFPPKRSFLANFLAAAVSWWRGLVPKAGRNEKIQMDAHLRRNCRRTESQGIQRLATSSTPDDEVSVIARVKDVKQFRDLPNVNRVVEIFVPAKSENKTLAAAEPDAFVTARIRGSEDEIEFLRNQGCVVSLKASRRVRPFMELTRREIMSCDNAPRDGRFEKKGGKGVIIGIVDFGLDFAHKNLRSNGGTRILALWDQKAPGAGLGLEKFGFGYGRLFTKAKIDEALNADDPYTALGYWVPKDSLSESGAHGTYVADVAAGTGDGSGCPGVAPEADIVFVDLSTGGTPMNGPQAAGSTFGDSVQLLEAIKFIFDYAGERPCVVNISLGTNGGPHDGTSLVELAIDRIVSEKPNRSVVIAAGNSFGRSLHATGKVSERGCVDLKWRIPRFDATSNELEVWYSNRDRFTVEVRDPAKKLVARVKPGWSWEDRLGTTGLMTIVNRTCDPNNQDNTINVFFERGVPAGNWTLRLIGDSVNDGLFHAWIERDEAGQSSFVKPSDGSYEVNNDCTLSSIACGRHSIVVGSYDANEADRPLSETSSSGPTRDDRQQPTVSAPGENVLAAHSGTVVLRHRQSGTSIAAAVVTGTVALMLSAARRPLEAEEIREILIKTANKERLNDKDWDSGYGYGIVCADKAVDEVRATNPPGEVVVPAPRLSART